VDLHHLFVKISMNVQSLEYADHWQHVLTHREVTFVIVQEDSVVMESILVQMLMNVLILPQTTAIQQPHVLTQ